MVDTTQIREHMEVVGADGGHLGTVDHLDAGRIKLTRRDSTDGQHHYLPLAAISAVTDGKLVTELPREGAIGLIETNGGGRDHTEA
ncbi:DUF2171 domain-containing protein [Roseomonas sp. BN140053]|uniref:DUF2171 domain-containing protein n=1 Tax=Roseomonas sp. BN140053 TaxID=3391898 RepID=UPI0039EC49DC